jgi:hypothetical protein
MKGQHDQTAEDAQDAEERVEGNQQQIELDSI